jgi:putative methionine-R-sulfoxide reductase with GAF domain
MTSLRGPDPYAVAEQALARLLARRAPTPLALCQILHETVPTYSWVAVVDRAGPAARVLAQQGTTRREESLAAGCAALLPHASTLVVADVRAAVGYRDCFPEARALIAVPLAHRQSLIITSVHRGAFGLADRDLLNMVARRWAETTTQATE